MLSHEIFAIILYFSVLFVIGALTYRRQLSEADFILGSRSMNLWLTAMSAQASDMSSWLFMAYPAAILLGGLFNAWTAIGLLLFMYLNWQFIAPRVRIATEQYGCMTFSSYFESRFADTSGLIRIFTALISMVFFTIYISAGLVGLGYLFDTMLHVSYPIGILVGVLVIVPYVFVGGYLTLAWIDLVQGAFLLAVILFVPLWLLPRVGGWAAIADQLHAQQLTTSLLPNTSLFTWTQILFVLFGWGLGYFGQPHIVTKFMGIRRVGEIHKSKYVGLSWMLLSLAGATLVGLVAIPFFARGLPNPELAFLEMVQRSFSPFVVGLILCAVLAATINATSSQVLVLCSNLSEDLYKRLFRKQATSARLLAVSRLSVVFVALLAYLIAYVRPGSIFQLVLYAWSGLGAAFGPLLLLSLYVEKLHKVGAWGGILTGGVTAGVWPLINRMLPVQIPPLIPGFALSVLMILVLSYVCNRESTQQESVP